MKLKDGIKTNNRNARPIIFFLFFSSRYLGTNVNLVLPTVGILGTPQGSGLQFGFHQKVFMFSMSVGFR